MYQTYLIALNLQINKKNRVVIVMAPTESGSEFLGKVTLEQVSNNASKIVLENQTLSLLFLWQIWVVFYLGLCILCITPCPANVFQAFWLLSDGAETCLFSLFRSVNSLSFQL